jgi:Ser/Thr protein kinase RdoA (MazF antagonist)
MHDRPHATDSDHLVHGLAGDDIVPDWPALARAELQALLRRFPQAGDLRGVNWHSPRPLSAACLVDTDAGELFVKRHHRRVRTPGTLTEEHAFIAHLRSHRLPLAEVLRDADGATAVPIGDWVYEVHRRAAGIDLYRELISWEPLGNPRHARHAGRMLARLHDASAGYHAPQRATHILVARSELIAAADPVAALEAQLVQRPGLAAYLRGRSWQREFAATLSPWHAALQPRLARQPRLWTHGDWHASNLCWDGSGARADVTAVLDFGLAAANCALFDLATAIERNAIAWLALDTGVAAIHPAIACALVEGYRELRPLSRDDVLLLADLLPLVHVDFAVSEVEYFHAITQAPAHADVAWETFLQGHAAWFATDPGQALLLAIRDLA